MNQTQLLCFTEPLSSQSHLNNFTKQYVKTSMKAAPTFEMQLLLGCNMTAIEKHSGIISIAYQEMVDSEKNTVSD